jgi:hypothetical protein
LIALTENRYAVPLFNQEKSVDIVDSGVTQRGVESVVVFPSGSEVMRNEVIALPPPFSGVIKLMLALASSHEARMLVGATGTLGGGVWLLGIEIVILSEHIQSPFLFLARTQNS